MTTTFPTLLEIIRTEDDGAVFLGEKRALIFDAVILGRAFSNFLSVNGPFESVPHIWNIGYACGFQFAMAVKPRTEGSEGKLAWFSETLARISTQGLARFKVVRANFDHDGEIAVDLSNPWNSDADITGLENAEFFSSFTGGVLSGAASAVKGETVHFIGNPETPASPEATSLGRTNWNDDDEVVKKLKEFAEDITNEPFSFSELVEKHSPTIERITKLITDLESKNVEIESLRVKLSQLQEVASKTDAETEMVGISSPFRLAFQAAKKVAQSSTTVLITGETGTGKELFARLIHRNSGVRNQPLITVNCAALPESLVESELFGHEKGAFTGAANRRPGRFEIANGSTIFLDEIGELPLDTQAKFLRVLQEGEFERLGGSQTIKTNVRVVAATNRDLWKMVEEGTFRSDLYYRLNVFPVNIPPLRERRNDIPLLIHFFAQFFKRQFKKAITSIDDRSIEALSSYSFPGNVRELKHIVERAVLLSDGEALYIDTPLTRFDTPNDAGSSMSTLDSSMTLEEMERRYITKVISDCKGMVAGKGGAAERLDLPPSTLRSKMKKLGIR